MGAGRRLMRRGYKVIPAACWESGTRLTGSDGSLRLARIEQSHAYRVARGLRTAHTISVADEVVCLVKTESEQRGERISSNAVICGKTTLAVDKRALYLGK
jgi:hypothetical protein